MNRKISKDLYRLMLTSLNGLDAKTARDRTNLFGRNQIIAKGRSPYLAVLSETLKDPMLWFIVFTSLLFLAVGDLTEAIILALALIPIMGMDFYLHWRVEASLEGLNRQLQPTYQAIRDGIKIDISLEELVPGDIVLMQANNFFPADGVILSGNEIQVDESTLTGESLSVTKKSYTFSDACLDESGESIVIQDVHWGYAGTKLLTGHLSLKVIFTGSKTFYGEIVQLAKQQTHEKTPLQVEMSKMLKTLLIFAGLFCFLLALTRWQQGFSIVDSMISAATLGVAAIPEEFPVVFTFFLGLGAYRLAQKKVLVRKAVCIENMGRLTYLCSDKTGTITEGRLKLLGYKLHLKDKALSMKQAAFYSSRKESEDPIDHAIIQAFQASVTDKVIVRKLFPFTEARRKETVIVQDPNDGIIAFCKGAPETIFAITNLELKDTIYWQNEVKILAESGYKIIACARKEMFSWDEISEPQSDFEFLGLLFFQDPIRDGVEDAFKKCERNGIKILILTGDHPDTAASIGKQVGLNQGYPSVVLADKVFDEHGNFNWKEDLLKNCDIISRALPSQKLKIVQKLKEYGEVVAVTGDGINDVPALKAADIGVAMGERGSQSAKDVAAMIILDDNFKTIVDAIDEGKALFRSLKASFIYLLGIHIPLVLTAALIPLFGYPLLYLPIHIIWLEILIHPTALLGFQQIRKSPIFIVPRIQQKSALFQKSDWLFTSLVGLFVTVGIYWIYLHNLGGDDQALRSRATGFAVLVLFNGIWPQILNFRGFNGLRSLPTFLTIVSILLIQIPTTASLLKLTPLNLNDWIDVIVIVVSAILIPLSILRTLVKKMMKKFET